MAKYHHALSRRDFMKALGLGTAGVGAAAAAVPLFADLDDMMSAGHEQTVKFKRAWYVKERELGDSTTETEWSQVTGHENNYIMNSTNGAQYAMGQTLVDEVSALGRTSALEAVQKKSGGFIVQDYALSNASGPSSDVMFWGTTASSYKNQNGLAKYQGSPEENSKMVRAAATFLGAYAVGFAVIEGDEKKICNVIHSEGRPFVWEAVDDPYASNEKIVVPNTSTMYAIAIGLEMSKEMFRHEYGAYGVGQLRGAANSDRYRRWNILHVGLQKFLNYLGYWAVGYPGTPYRGLLPAGGDAILAGLCEGGRMTNTFISPEHGMVQGYFSMVTNLPLAPTAPIDAGIRRFCKTCGKCAEVCPSEAISKEKEPTWDGHFDVNNYKYFTDKSKPFKCVAPGKKNWIWDATACRYGSSVKGGCAACMGACTFNTNNGAGIHDFVKGTVATTSLFNGFFARADTFYGFGLTPDDKKDEWWDKSLPVSGINSILTAYDGGYRKTGS